MLTAEEKTSDVPEKVNVNIVEPVDNTENAKAPKKVEGLATINPKGWHDNPDVEIVKKAILFLASKMGFLAELQSLFPTL